MKIVVETEVLSHEDVIYTHEGCLRLTFRSIVILYCKIDKRLFSQKVAAGTTKGKAQCCHHYFMYSHKALVIKG